MGDFRMKWHLKDNRLNLNLTWPAICFFFIKALCHPQKPTSGGLHQKHAALELQRIAQVHYIINYIWLESSFLDPGVQELLGIIVPFRPYTCRLTAFWSTLLPPLGQVLPSPTDRWARFSGPGNWLRNLEHILFTLGTGTPVGEMSIEDVSLTLPMQGWEGLKDRLQVVNSNFITLPMVRFQEGEQPQGILTGSLVEKKSLLLHTYFCMSSLLAGQ